MPDKSVKDLIVKTEGPKDIAVRALKTAVQVFFSLVTADALFQSFNPTLVHEAAISAMGAGASVLMNALLAWART